MLFFFRNLGKYIGLTKVGVNSGVVLISSGRHSRIITKTNIFKYTEILPQKNQIKNSDIFRISAQNIACRYSLEPPRQGASNEYPQSMFLSRNKKNNVHP